LCIIAVSPLVLVIIQIINVTDVFTVEPEDDSPVAAYHDGPEAFQVAGHGMKPQARQTMTGSGESTGAGSG